MINMRRSDDFMTHTRKEKNLHALIVIVTRSVFYP